MKQFPILSTAKIACGVNSHTMGPHTLMGVKGSALINTLAHPQHVEGISEERPPCVPPLWLQDALYHLCFYPCG